MVCPWKKGTLVIDDWDCQGKIIHSIDSDNQWEEEIIYSKAGLKDHGTKKWTYSETIELSEPEDVVDDLTVVYDQFIDAIEKAELTIKPEEPKGDEGNGSTFESARKMK